MTQKKKSTTGTRRFLPRSSVFSYLSELFKFNPIRRFLRKFESWDISTYRGDPRFPEGWEFTTVYVIDSSGTQFFEEWES